MAQWERKCRWWTIWWYEFDEDLMAIFDEMEYHFVDEDVETGSEAFQRMMGVDGSAYNTTRKTGGTEEDFQEQFRPPFLTKGDEI